MSDSEAAPDSELGPLLDDVRRHLAWQREAMTRTAAVAFGGGANWIFADRAQLAAAAAPAVVSAAPAAPAVVSAAPAPAAVPMPSRPAAPAGEWTKVELTPPAAAAPAPALERKALDEIRVELGDCKRCKLCGTRKQIVFGVGNPRAELVFVGEGPGADEDAQGIPFVGKAGQLLTKMIEAMGFSRDDVYICNVVKCRPPNNRNPEPDEIDACEPFLQAQLRSIQPKVIVALGKFAAQTLLRDPAPISRLRGSWREYCGIKLMPTFHPAYLLRSPEEKKHAWADLKQVMKFFGKEPRAE